MSGTAQIKMLTRYNAWANKKMFDAVAALPEGEAVKERTTLFKNMVNTLNHQYVVHLIWQAHLEGRDHGMSARNSAESPTLEQWWPQQQAIDKWYEQWSDKQTDETLADRRPIVLIGGNRVVMSQAEMLLHLYHHTAYHRGFVGDMMYAVPGCRPPVTDLPVFLREAPQSH